MDPLEISIAECVREVWKELRYGYSESVYQRALDHEFRLRSIQYTPQFTLQLYYKGYRVGTGIADFIIVDPSTSDSYMVELKQCQTEATIGNGVSHCDAYCRASANKHRQIVITFMPHGVVMRGEGWSHTVDVVDNICVEDYA